MTNWKMDLKRYGGYRAFLREQSIYNVAIYRIGSSLDKCNFRFKFLGKTFKFFYYFLFRIFETFTSISIPKETQIGGGLRIWHFGNIFINSETIIGKNCTLRQGVTIGSKNDSSGSPVIGDNVDIGTNVVIIGNIKIGSNCIIGAMSLVNKDIPENSVIAGIPAKVIKKNENNILY